MNARETLAEIKKEEVKIMQKINQAQKRCEKLLFEIEEERESTEARIERDEVIRRVQKIGSAAYILRQNI